MFIEVEGICELMAQMGPTQLNTEGGKMGSRKHLLQSSLRAADSRSQLPLTFPVQETQVQA